MLDKPKKYKIVISKDALWDIKSTKKYILDTFKYREYAENFSKKKKIKKAINELESFPKGYEVTGYVIEGLSVYFNLPVSVKQTALYMVLRNHKISGLFLQRAASFFRPMEAGQERLSQLRNCRHSVKPGITKLYFHRIGKIKRIFGKRVLESDRK